MPGGDSREIAMFLCGTEKGMGSVPDVENEPLGHRAEARRQRHLVPLLVERGSVAIAGRNRFSRATRGPSCRAAVENIKREIFRYRTRSGGDRHADREAVLAPKIEDVTRRLARTR